MKTFIIAVSVALLGLGLGASAVSADAGFVNCAGSMYSEVCSDAASYSKKDLVTFSIYQHRIPLFIGVNEHPWHITDESGQTIFTPESTPPSVQPDGTFSFTDTWDQRDDSGKHVKKGLYHIVFPNMPYNMRPLAISIENGK